MFKQILVFIYLIILIIPSFSFSQTCNPNIEKTTPDDYFTDNKDGTITDNITGLMWKKCSEGQNNDSSCSGDAKKFNWKNALQRAKESNFAGYNDWRLPNIKELRSIVEYACYSPSINLNFFSNTQSSYYWSSSSDSNNSNNAWNLNVSYGNDGYGNKTSTSYVRLVRAGQ